jgi:hypothetical protein
LLRGEIEGEAAIGLHPSFSGSRVDPAFETLPSGISRDNLFAKAVVRVPRLSRRVFLCAHSSEFSAVNNKKTKNETKRNMLEAFSSTGSEDRN